MQRSHRVTYAMFIDAVTVLPSPRIMYFSWMFARMKGKPRAAPIISSARFSSTFFLDSEFGTTTVSAGWFYGERSVWNPR